MSDKHFDLLQELGGTGHLKLGMQGGTGAGKSYTAVEVAIGLKLDWGLDGPIAMFDTEKGSAFLRERVKAETGQPLLGYLGRSRDLLLRWIDQCIKAGVAVGIVDSATHVSDETRDSFVVQRNQKTGRTDRRLQIDEIMQVGDAWKPVVDAILNAPMHLIVCGRLGFDWGHEDVDGSGNLQLVRTDRKMKAMGGLGYEFDLVCDIERKSRRVAPGGRGKGAKKATILTDESVHILTVVKDRFDELDGSQIEDPTFAFFKTYTDKLDRGVTATVDTTSETNHGMDGSGANKWRQEKRDRTILAEKVQEELTRCWPGSKADMKAARQDHAETFFGTRSWTEISETMDVEQLRSGWVKLFRYCRGKFPVARIDVDALVSSQPPAVETTRIEAPPGEPEGDESTPAITVPRSDGSTVEISRSEAQKIGREFQERNRAYAAQIDAEPEGEQPQSTEPSAPEPNPVNGHLSSELPPSPEGFDLADLKPGDVVDFMKNGKDGEEPTRTLGKVGRIDGENVLVIPVNKTRPVRVPLKPSHVQLVEQVGELTEPTTPLPVGTGPATPETSGNPLPTKPGRLL